MRSVKPEVDLFGKLARRILQRHDLLRKNLRFIFGVVDLSYDQHRLIRHEQFTILVVILIHAEHRNAPFQILQSHHCVRLVGLFRYSLLHGGDQAADARQRAIGQLRGSHGVRQCVLLQQRHVRGERMARHVKSEQFFFRSQQFVLRPLRQCCAILILNRCLLLQHAKERALPSLPVLHHAGRARQGAVDCGEERRPRLPKTVARPRPDQCFEHLAVDRARIDSLAKLSQRSKAAPCGARLQNRLHRHFTDAFDRGEPKANGRFGLPANCGRERHLSLVHIGRQHLDSHGARLVQQHAQFVRVAHVVRHQRAHEFHRIIRLQVCRLIRHNRVRRRVRFVETVSREFFQ